MQLVLGPDCPDCEETDLWKMLMYNPVSKVMELECCCCGKPASILMDKNIHKLIVRRRCEG